MQKAPSTTHSTPRATPGLCSISPHVEDIVRIHVTYSSPDDPPTIMSTNVHYSNSDDSLQDVVMKDQYAKHPVSLPGIAAVGDYRIRIQVPLEEMPTPLVDGGRIKSFDFCESPDRLDLT